MSIGIQFVDTDGAIYDPDSDDNHAAWLAAHRPEKAAQFAELRATLADRPAWMRHRRSGYTAHAVTARNGYTAIVVGDPSGWAWQVYRTGGDRPLRDIRDTPAGTAADALALADDFIDRQPARPADAVPVSDDLPNRERWPTDVYARRGQNADKLTDG